MAGRPAARGGGMSGQTVAIVAFAAISVISLGLFIFQLTSNKQYAELARKAKDREAQFGVPSSYYVEEAAGRGAGTSAFAVMESDLRDMAKLVTGNPEAVRPAVVSEIGTVLKTIEGTDPGLIKPTDSLKSTLLSLHKSYTELKKAKAEVEDRLAKVQAEREALTIALQNSQNEYQEGVKRVGDQLAAVEADKNELLELKDRQLQTFQANADAKAEEASRIQTERQAERRESEIERGRLTNQLNRLQDTVRSLRPQAGDPGAILKQVDGRVKRAMPGSDIVYIDLGRADGLKLGLGFEVFSARPDLDQALLDRAAQAAEIGDLSESIRGKAAIEVVTLEEHTAECRVVRPPPPGRPIIEGDLLVNILYEKGRKPKFVLRGAFDLDYDGNVDVNDADRVAAIIREYGGQVVPELDETSEYLVLGVAPFVPDFPPNRPVSPSMLVMAERAAADRSEFAKIIEDAKTLNIPIVTQSRLLFLTGYAGNPTYHQRMP